jgi:hypothetical protein
MFTHVYQLRATTITGSRLDEDSCVRMSMWVLRKYVGRSNTHIGRTGRLWLVPASLAAACQVSSFRAWMVVGVVCP